jgi:hypothetical protein
MGCMREGDGTWFQCFRGTWYAGGDAKQAAVGPCTSVYGK